MTKLRIFVRTFTQVREIIFMKENQFLSKVIPFFCYHGKNNENPKTFIGR